MTDETSPDAVNIQIKNFPPGGSTGELRTVAFGPTGPMRILIDIDMNEAETEVEVSVTLSNAAPNDGIGAFLGDLIELLSAVTEDPTTITALLSAEAEESAV
ncbi:MULTISPECIES: hypothetical protein [unclassified Microbacterium]|uniref:hypothetical protein n=1 Tax=unclassified Microbacterium TaxID=2609290 RepID=UPI000EA8FE4B|nr:MULTISPECIES: hypothetical protein [unclassified Microbacterium]MBT2484779.1 hypothetical protein [Microbacterium sp. ISL-108]RKN67655.1 hypothetical protein D7252_08705 [Microbacterium sp. CGR2]